MINPKKVLTARRMFVVVSAAVLVITINLFAGGVASAHVVTSINADCYVVTVHFSDFPDSGVTVHIAAGVTGQATISRDVLVTSATSAASLDISAATAALYDTTGQVDVDVTWTYQGPQHVHESFTVTCGTATTTTSATTTTTTEAPTTTTEAPTTTTEAPTTTTGPETTTSLRVLGSTTIVTATTAPVATTTDTVGPQGSTAPTTNTTLPVGSVTLPRTGSDVAFPVMFGLSSLIAGALLVLRRGRVWSS